MLNDTIENTKQAVRNLQAAIYARGNIEPNGLKECAENISKIERSSIDWSQIGYNKEPAHIGESFLTALIEKKGTLESPITSLKNRYLDNLDIIFLPDLSLSDTCVDFAAMCQRASNLKSVSKYLNFYNARDLSYAFSDCASLVEFPKVEISNSLTKLNQMFQGCVSLRGDSRGVLDLSLWDTSNVTSIQDFLTSTKVKKLILPKQFCGPKCKNVTILHNRELTEISNVSDWDLSSEPTIGFRGCYKLKSIPGIENWKGTISSISFGSSGSGYESGYEGPLDLSHITILKPIGTYAYWNCYYMTYLNISNAGDQHNYSGGYNTVFTNCYEMKTIVFPENWLSAKCNGNFSQFFMNCFELKQVVNINTVDVTVEGNVNFDGCFYGCKALEELDLSNWKFTNISNIGYMFNGCHSLTSVNITHNNFNIENASISSVFKECHSLSEIPSFFKNRTFRVASALDYTFYGLSSMEHIDLSSITIEKPITSMKQCFYQNISGKFSLTKKITLPTFDTSSCANMDSMFNGCSKLEVIEGELDITASSYTSNMFTGCTSLTTVWLKGWEILNSTLRLNGTKISPECIHYLIENADGSYKKTLSLSPSSGAAWEESEWYEDDLSMIDEKKIVVTY